MQSKYYKSKSCARCNEPIVNDHCGCDTHAKTVPVVVQEWQCDVRYNAGECVGIDHCGGQLYYTSKLNNNINNKPGTDSTWWSEPAESLCELIAMSGVKGDTGATGPTGPVGPQGLQGPAGQTGATGQTGQDGPVGPQGIQGETGQDGPVGQQGIRGDTGQIGPQGPTGLTGPEGQGIQGIQGPEGNVGPQGIQGPIGPQGVKGDNGLPYNPDEIVETLPPDFECPPTGTSSVYEASTGLLHFCVDGVRQPPVEFGRGEKGEQGGVGPAGPEGPRGLEGQAGPVGPEGPRGLQGQTGLVGPAGQQGVRGDVGPVGPQGLQGIQGPVGPVGLQGLRGEQGLIGPIGPIGPQGPVGPQGLKGDPGTPGGPPGPVGPAPTIGENGNWFIDGNDTGIPARGPKGEAGKDYDPNCQAPTVVEIICADAKGNITLVFEDDEGEASTQLMPVAVFKPTNKDLLNAVENVNPDTGEKYWTTTNHIDAKITWFKKPTVGMLFILSDFRAGALTDHNKQALRFEVLDMNGGCLGRGMWELLIECNNCNCIIPSITVQTDATGKECAVWNDGKGKIVKLALCNTSSCGPVDQYPNCDPLLAKRWEPDCNKGVHIGYYTYQDGYWLNTKTANTAEPESLDGWYGPFDAYQLMQQHMELYVNDRVAIIVEQILRMRGLI